jgi:hypothetical protein
LLPATCFAGLPRSASLRSADARNDNSGMLFVVYCYDGNFRFTIHVTPTQVEAHCAYHTDIIHGLNTMDTGLRRYDENNKQRLADSS